MIQYSRDGNDQPRSRGVLDTRLRGYDELHVRREDRAVIASEAKQSISPHNG
jgi:hypothetical protein